MVANIFFSTLRIFTCRVWHLMPLRLSKKCRQITHCNLGNQEFNIALHFVLASVLVTFLTVLEPNTGIEYCVRYFCFLFKKPTSGNGPEMVNVRIYSVLLDYLLGVVESAQTISWSILNALDNSFAGMSGAPGRSGQWVVHPDLSINIIY